MPSHRHLLTGLLLAALPLATSAQTSDEAPKSLNWNVTATSEYLFRGISQSDDKPALQAGFDYNFSTGLYAGAWTSTVDFGDSTDAELDTFVGWNRDLGESLNIDLQWIRYNYVGEPAAVDYAYNEWIGILKVSKVYGFTLGYTDDYINTGENGFYYAVAGDWDLGSDYALHAGVGYTVIGGPAKNYLDYSLGVSRKFGVFTVGLNYTDTSKGARTNFGKDAGEEKIGLSVSIEG